MTRLPILEIPHPLLRQTAEPVAAVDNDIRQLLDNMLETMYASKGVGLAGNQVGVLKRIIVIDCNDEEGLPKPIRLVNPRIMAQSDEIVCHNEGCLSIPQEYADIDRPACVTVAYQDETGTERTIKADGLLAIALQHEIDHLDGKLFVDYLSPLRRKRLLNHLEKQRRKEKEEA